MVVESNSFVLQILILCNQTSRRIQHSFLLNCVASNNRRQAHSRSFHETGDSVLRQFGSV